MNLEIPEVKFFPWVGNAYEDGYRDRKFLILGESEYQRPGYTLESDLVSLLIAGGKHRFYRKVYRSISNESIEHFDSFWKSVAFYNFVQVAVGTGPRQRPSKEMWRVSETPFRLVLSRLKPDRILVLGQELWCNLWNLGIMSEESEGSSRFFLTCEERRVRTACIRHPASWGFRPAAWRNVVSDLLD